MSAREAIERRSGLLLLFGVFVVAVSGLIYELLAGTLSSYLLGDSVTQFSLVVGLFLTAMGIGSWLSRYVRAHLMSWFVGVELAVGLVGGLTALIGFLSFSTTELYGPVLVTLVLLVGMGVGMEIPLVIRLLREHDQLHVTLANVLTVDYVGALAASVIFPFVLIPHMGLVRAGLVAGIANAAVAALLLWKLQALVTRRRVLWAGTVLVTLVLTGSLLAAGQLTRWMEDRLYQDEILFAKDTGHQRLVVTRFRDDIRLYLNGHLQFSTVDEYRYHEALIHPAMALAERPRTVLILGGGDGLAVRQVLAYEQVERVDLVDLDPEVVRLFRDNPMLREVNGGALSDPRVTVTHADALRFLEQSDQRWDVIVMDLPDPSEPALGKLYSRAFFRLAGRHLSAGGVLASQATSPFRAREAFWSIVATAEAARWGPQQSPIRLYPLPYHTLVPTFGTWGFFAAATRPRSANEIRLSVPTRYLSEEMLPGLFVFPPDMARLPVAISELDDPAVVRFYRDGYHQYLE